MKELSLKNCRLDGRYDIYEILGRGSYAEIYVARDTLASPHSPHSQVVIKALNVFLQNDLDADLERTLVENFQNEAIALDLVRHPNIISRLGHGTARDLRGTVFHYLVLEYLPGGDLSRLCREKSLSFENAFFYLEQVCAGLSHAHQKGVIHRDIKPQNLLLSKDLKTVKIADFGVARFSHSDSPITRVGTNIYAPPEHSPMIADGDVLTVSELTPAADIYSLAKSAYVLITGESPRFFANQPIAELPISVRHRPWASELLAVLQKATQNNPQERYQAVGEFWQSMMQVKSAAAEESVEIRTQVAMRQSNSPKPHVSRGYTPLAPQRPQFNTSRELKLDRRQIPAPKPLLVVRIDDEEHADRIAGKPLAYAPAGSPAVAGTSIPVESANSGSPERPNRLAPRPKNTLLWRFTSFLVALSIFTGILYATHNYLAGSGFFPEIRNPFNSKPTGIATTDVNLRMDGSSDSRVVGVVPKNSRVRIVNVKDNWYQVDVIEFGRPKENPSHAEHGWVYKRYVEVQE